MPDHSPAEIIAALQAEGIHCEPHELGLARYATDPTAYARELRKITGPQPEPTTFPTQPRCHGYSNGCVCHDCSTRAGVVLRVLTMSDTEGTAEPPPCTDDPMVCTCPTHQGERVRAIRTGPRGAGPAAFAVKTARRAA
jgi:hypothetical protein